MAKVEPVIADDLPLWVELGRLAGFVWTTARRTPGPIAAVAAVALAQGLVVPLELVATKRLVDAVAAQVAGGQGEWGLWLGVMAGALLCGRVLGSVRGWIEACARERVGRDLTQRVMQKATRLELAAFEHAPFHDQLRRVLSESESRGADAVTTVLNLFTQIPALISYCVALWWVSPFLFGVALIAYLPAVIYYTWGGKAIWRQSKALTRDLRLADYYAKVQSDRQAAKEVRLYGLQPHLREKWAQLFQSTRERRRRLQIVLELRERLLMVGAVTAGAIGLWWSVARVGAVHSAGMYAVLFQAFDGFIGQAFRVAQTLRSLGEHAGYAAEWYAFVRLPEEERERTAGKPPVAFPELIRRGIRFESVTFTYPGQAQPAVRDVSFSISSGEKVALVGENGAGKTTLTKLLLGLYRPDSGRITIDGVDLAEMDIAEVRRRMSAVMQQIVHYPLTISENVALRPAAEIDHARLQEAVALGGAADVVASLEGRYDALLGPDIGGGELSGGQWQRVALARGVYRAAPILVMDEPTSALDPLAELAVFTQFVDLAAGRTCLLVSHRLGMTRLADRVLVLADGRLIEDGPHEQLLQSDGSYAELFAAQARWYA